MKTTIERAYELARSGEVDSVTALKRRLKAEGYEPNLLSGAALIRSLGEACRAANGRPARPGPQPKPRRLTPEERSQAARRGAATRAGLKEGGRNEA